jgi:FKBP-type peptidyl-prolyl cis-trans isomerase
MAYIITSKTRARIMSQPKERNKLMTDRRMKSQEKHLVQGVNPIAELSELEIHEDMDKNGSEVRDVMQATEEINAEKTKKKQKARMDSSSRKKNVKERVEKLEARDRKSGLLDKAEKTRKRGKKK